MALNDFTLTDVPQLVTLVPATLVVKRTTRTPNVIILSESPGGTPNIPYVVIAGQYVSLTDSIATYASVDASESGVQISVKSGE